MRATKRTMKHDNEFGFVQVTAGGLEPGDQLMWFGLSYLVISVEFTDKAHWLCIKCLNGQQIERLSLAAGDLVKRVCREDEL